MSREWNESLFGCFDDFGTCLCGWCCAPCLYGQNAEKIDGSSCCCQCFLYTILIPCYLCWVPHCLKRKTLREKYGLREDPSCGDCLTTFFCGECALCQEARFLERQGNLPSGHIAAAGPYMNQPRQ
ncbi:hypothetical protein I4U23_023542 [Adineta vaga]|nr:hypothetical protein I4U23_023542 [Adineta vaga]